MIFQLPSFLTALLTPQTDASKDWNPEIPTPEDLDEASIDRTAAAPLSGQPPIIYPIVNVEIAASRVTYDNGIVKRTRFQPVDLSKRKVIIGLHQGGFERGEVRLAKTVQKVTCHRAIGPTGTRYRVHPLVTRLVCTNAFDREPWHCIGIEQIGNMEGTVGKGDWYKPSVFGRGALSVQEREALLQEIAMIMSEVRDLGAQVIGIVPHRVSGRDLKGRPNRPLCPGSAIWSQVGERAAVEFGLRIPSDKQKWGGLTILPAWHGEHYAAAVSKGLVGL